MFAALDVTTDRRRGAAADARPVGGDGRPADRRASRSATRRRSRRAAAVRHRRGDGPRAALADHHRRLRAEPVRRPVRPGRPDARRADPVRHHPRRRGAEARRCPTATCASRPARTIRRSSSTPSATWSGRPAARPCCGGRSSASAGRRRPAPGRRTPRNLMGFKDGTRNIHADDTAALDEHVWVGARAACGRAVDGERVLPGRPQDPDGDRVLGHRPARPTRSGSSPGTRTPARR